MDDPIRRHDISRLLLGLMVCALGVVFTLDHLGWMDAGHIGSYWPLFLVVFGLSRLLQAPGGRGRGFGLVMVVVGTWWTLYNLEIVDINVWRVWPVLLIIAGLGMVLEAFGLRRRREVRSVSGFSPTDVDLMAPPPAGSSAPPPMPPAGDDRDAYVDGLAILGGFKRVVTSRQFRGGSLTAFMGGCNVDLRQASIAGDTAILDTMAFWGGIEIKVPSDWTVVLQGTPILGGFEDKTTQRRGDGSKTLIIRGFAVMGGVGVTD
ncbi:MAG TPA: DUF5668 domain-containing protein [Thermoanaerobaculaceae bacterium]|nr:DUF5668 domain-containing protein [Thermoanaerobaculaceae bacterium]